MTVVDDLGRRVSIVINPGRLISLAPSVTEVVFALGAGPRLVGDTTFCDYPPEAATVERVGDTEKPSLERIIALKPDLVIVSTASQLERFEAQLERIGVPVYVCAAASLDDLVGSIQRLGAVLGDAATGVKLAGRLRARIGSVRSRVAALPHPRVLLIVSSEPLMTAGGNTFVGDLIASAGGRSISADLKEDFPRYSMETALAKQPEIIFLQSGDDPLPSQLQNTPAARDHRVYRLDDALILRPGPRIVDGLEVMARDIHPEAFR